MKVWYILMAFPSPSETFVGNDVEALVRLGIDVSVHSLRGPRRDARTLLRDRGLSRLTVTHATPGNVLRGFAAMLLRPRTAARLVAWIVRHADRRPVHVVKGLALLPRLFGLLREAERERPDVVHVYWGHYPAIFGHLLLERAPGVVVSLSLSAYDLLRKFPGSAAVARRAHLVSTWAAANVPAIAAFGVPPEAVHVSWQGLDLEKVRNRRFQKVRHRVVTAGRLIPEKAMDDVLRAFARIASTHPDARLVVLGDGPDRGRLQRTAESLGVGAAVVFRGHVAHDEVFEELARAELFLFLSRYRGERLPNVVKEAMACQCLVITTATPGIDELLETGVHGHVVDAGDWEHAAELATEAFSNPEGARTLIAAAHARALERFDSLRLMEEMVRKWERLRAGRGRENSSARAPSLSGAVLTEDALDRDARPLQIAAVELEAGHRLTECDGRVQSLARVGQRIEAARHQASDAGSRRQPPADAPGAVGPT